jgi:hypothetical protein
MEVSGLAAKNGSGTPHCRVDPTESDGTEFDLKLERQHKRNCKTAASKRRPGCAHSSAFRNRKSKIENRK